MAQGDPSFEDSHAGAKSWSFDPDTKPPAFGHSLKKYFGFEENYINLNNGTLIFMIILHSDGNPLIGSFGSLPLPVFSECSKIQLLAEQNPDKFHRITYMPLLNESR